MTLTERFKEFISENQLFGQADKLLLAVSGGVDSVVLCELCAQAGFDFSIAHCNFRLRGAESERDRAFVEHLAKKYSVPFFLKEFDTKEFAEQHRLSIQETARNLRYDWFGELVAGEQSLVFTLTAHHADDNIETILMNFCRGTGLHGLTGIPVKSSVANIRRPLLSFWKEELLEFATTHNLGFVEDSSNQSSKYTRNLFRNEVIPLIAQAYPQLKQNLSDNLQRFGEINRLYEISVGEIKKKLLKSKGDEIHIPVKQLMQYKNRALIFEIISPFGFSEKQIDEVIKLADSGSGKFIQSPVGPTRIIKFRNWLVISKNRPVDEGLMIIEKGMGEIEIETGKLKIEETAYNAGSQLPASNAVACLDAKGIAFPLIIRKWREGDYFYPLGMKKKKKLARFFIDQKLSKTQKENIRVIEMDKKIIWVVGWRIDDRFRITPSTKNILRLTLETT